MTKPTRHAILVVGDVMLDRRVEGEMRRISPEAPAPIVRQTDFREMPGGAANVAANIAALGRKTYLLGLVGDDYAGQTLGHMLPTQYNVNANLIVSGNAKTITKIKVTAAGQQVLRIDDELDEFHDAHKTDWLRAMHALLTEHTEVGLIVVSDYNKGTLKDSLIRALMEQAKELGVPVYVDTKPDKARRYTGAALLKPNLSEARAMCESVIHPALGLWLEGTEDEAECLVQSLLQNFSVDAVALTRGGAGTTFQHRGGELFTSSVTTQEVFDVTGAGDTFMAVLADARVAGYDWPSAVLRANTAASEAVRHHGTTIVSRQQLEDAVKKRLGWMGKVYTRETISRYAARSREEGQRVVLANGCFRYIHHGHWDMLRWAKAQGNKLIVAVNSDQSIRALRGEVSFVPQTYRQEMLASIPFVDAVVFFDEECAEQVVRDIHPDILVKGQEYQSTNCPGADWLATKGAEVRFAPMTEGIHATDLEPPTC